MNLARDDVYSPGDAFDAPLSTDPGERTWFVGVLVDGEWDLFEGAYERGVAERRAEQLNSAYPGEPPCEAHEDRERAVRLLEQAAEYGGRP